MGDNMNNKKNDKTVFAYLKSIPSGPLLTKSEEIQLIQNIEVYQKEILGQLVVAKYSRHQLKVYLESLNSSGEEIVDISKKLDEESSKEAQAEVAGHFKALIIELNKANATSWRNVTDLQKCIENIHALLAEVSLTGTIIHGVVTEIKKKHTRISEVESKYKSVRKYFGNETDDEIMAQIVEESPVLKSRIKLEYSLTDVKASNKLTEWKQILNEYMDVAKTITDGTFDDVKNAYRSISDFEFKAAKYKNELITKNLRLVISRAKAHLNKGLDFEDLIQEGNIGLMKAVDKFDSSKKTKVSTYATWWIDQSIKRAISNKGKTVRVPTHIEWMETNLRKTIQKLVNKLGRQPTLKEISADSGIELKVLEDLQTRAQHEIGLEEELSSGMSLIDILPSDPMQSPATLVEQKLLREKIREILATLPPRTEKIIRLRFGIGEVPDDEGTTLQSIADQVGITKQGVRVVECSAFKQLRKKARRLVNE
jgi:RNA polymerase primary sigma factor